MLTLWSVAKYADTSGNSEKSGVQFPIRVRVFPDLQFDSPVAIEESYFLERKEQGWRTLPEWRPYGTGA
jgi:hypothetical protein